MLQLLVMVVRSEYQWVQMTRKQSNLIKELIANKINWLEINTKYPPLFDGASFNLSDSIVCCKNDATKHWLELIVPNIEMEGS